MKKKKRTYNGPDFALRSSSLGLLQGKPFYPDFFLKKKIAIKTKLLENLGT